MTLQGQEKRNIKVTLHTKITHGRETESYELITFGTLLSKGSDIYIQYREENEAGTVQTTIKHKPHETLLLRSGSVKMRQLFRLQEKTNGQYESVYGILGLTTTATKIDHTWNERLKEGKLSLRYQMHMQGGSPGKYELTISYREEV
ncbi:DUF1934 domain-containing protein [Bacillus massiliglaciei]|uniref:DUF1934 domain-containing protein n=1 Tax=Bacillus massiliglaciei TaxID=1816693 RepID=UPI000DA62D91|nr:DUF1934 domain-containing protein [Bacillus massiliglaciei]